MSIQNPFLEKVSLNLAISTRTKGEHFLTWGVGENPIPHIHSALSDEVDFLRFLLIKKSATTK